MSPSVAPPPGSSGSDPQGFSAAATEDSGGSDGPGRRRVTYALAGAIALVTVVVIALSLSSGSDDAEGSRTFLEWTVHVETGTSGTGMSITADGKEYIIGDGSPKAGQQLFAIKTTWLGAIRCTVKGRAAFDCAKTGENNPTFTLVSKSENPPTLKNVDGDAIQLLDGDTPASAQYPKLVVGRQVTCELVNRSPLQVRNCESGALGVTKSVTPTLLHVQPGPSVPSTPTASTPTVTTPADLPVGSSVTVTIDYTGTLSMGGAKYLSIADRDSQRQWVLSDGTKAADSLGSLQRGGTYTCTVAPSLEVGDGLTPLAAVTGCRPAG